MDKGPIPVPELQQKQHLKERPAMVLFPALCAIGMAEYTSEGLFQLTELGKYATAGCPANLIGYAGLEKQDAGVLQMTEWLRNDGPENAAEGFSYVR